MDTCMVFAAQVRRSHPYVNHLPVCMRYQNTADRSIPKYTCCPPHGKGICVGIAPRPRAHHDAVNQIRVAYKRPDACPLDKRVPQPVKDFVCYCSRRDKPAQVNISSFLSSLSSRLELMYQVFYRVFSSSTLHEPGRLEPKSTYHGSARNIDQSQL
jgi:hypothetical protein